MLWTCDLQSLREFFFCFETVNVHRNKLCITYSVGNELSNSSLQVYCKCSLIRVCVSHAGLYLPKWSAVRGRSWSATGGCPLSSWSGAIKGKVSLSTCGGICGILKKVMSYLLCIIGSAAEECTNAKSETTQIHFEKCDTVIEYCSTISTLHKTISINYQH
jgi:hypothetical protein